jgi:hypothetical protein
MTTPLWRELRDAKLDAHIHGSSGHSYAAMLHLIASKIKPPLSRAAIREWLEAEAQRAERGA